MRGYDDQYGKQTVVMAAISGSLDHPTARGRGWLNEIRESVCDNITGYDTSSIYRGWVLYTVYVPVIKYVLYEYTYS